MNLEQKSEAIKQQLGEAKQSFKDFIRDLGKLTYLTVRLAIPAIILLVIVGIVPFTAGLPPAMKAITIIVTIAIGLTLGARFCLRRKELVEIAMLLASLGRWLDMRANWNRFDRNRWRKIVAMHGHTWKVTALALLFTGVLIFGPNWWRESDRLDGWIPVLIFIVAVVFIAVINFYSNIGKGDDAANIRKRDRRYNKSIVFLLLTMFGITVVCLVLAEPSGRAVEYGLYRHLWQFLAVILLILLIGAAGLARLLFVKYREKMNPCVLQLDTVSALSEIGKKQDFRIEWKRFFRSLVKAPFYHLIPVLFFLSVPVLLVAENSTMVRWAFYSGLLAWTLYAMGDMHERLAHLLGSLHRMFFLGGQLIVSLVVIALAVGRLFDNSYVTTLVEGQGRGVFSNVTLLGYIVSSYIAFWFYEYWSNRILSDRLIAMFVGYDKTPGRVNVGVGNIKTLQVHGGSRFAAVETSKIDRTYGRIKLIDHVREKSTNGTDSGQLNLVLQHRIRFYFTALNIGFVLPVAIAAYMYNELPQRAEVESAAKPPVVQNSSGGDAGSQLLNLESVLFAAPEKEECNNRHTIVLAASGGGTRAALYSYSVLRGLRQIELNEGCSALDRVLLLSGVSGGSAAVAYFKANRQDLLKHAPGLEEGNPWREFRKAMIAPFIQDVLLGISEMRLLYGCKRGKRGEFREGLRLSSLLRESFDRRMGNKMFENGCSPIATSTGSAYNSFQLGSKGPLEGIGVIFNTTLSGRFPIEDRDLSAKCPSDQTATEGCNWPISKIESFFDPPRTTSAGKGGRLVFTNLVDSRNLFPTGDDEGRPNYAIIDDPNVPLVTAAALSANFPPVFPNAAVDKGNLSRYWVTDGGAADNRGIVSLLHVLSKTVERLPKSNGEKQQKTNDATSYPTLHILLADASAADLAFAQDRGIGSALAAAERFASEIITDMRTEIKNGYSKVSGAPKIEYHNLTMPLALRSNGGVGTHWMLPDSILMRPPFGSNSEADDTKNRKMAKMAEPCNDSDGDIGVIGSLLRFLSLRKTGCEIDRKEILTLFDMLHAIDGDVSSAKYQHIAEKKPNALKWMCENSPGVPQHEASWRSLVNALGKSTAYNGYCPEG